MDTELGEDRLKKEAKWYCPDCDKIIASPFPGHNQAVQLVTLQRAEEEIQRARRESTQIDEDCVQMWQERYQRLAQLFNETFGIQWEEERDMSNTDRCLTAICNQNCSDKCHYTNDIEWIKKCSHRTL